VAERDGMAIAITPGGACHIERKEARQSVNINININHFAKRSMLFITLIRYLSHQPSPLAMMTSFMT
jgi:hypothetical protein